MKYVVQDGAKMIELTDEELAELDSRLEELHSGKVRGITDEELDEMFRKEDEAAEQSHERRAA